MPFKIYMIPIISFIIVAIDSPVICYDSRLLTLNIIYTIIVTVMIIITVLSVLSLYIIALEYIIHVWVHSN